MENAMYIISIILFSIALIDVASTFRSLFRAIKAFKKLKLNPDKKEVSLNIPFKIYYGLIADVLLMIFLIFYWIN